MRTWRAPCEVSRRGQQVDVGSSVETGQLELATPANAYLRSGRFSTEDMLDYWQAADETQAEEGFGLTITGPGSLTTDDYALCVFNPNLALQLDAPAGGVCGTSQCWKVLSIKGFASPPKQQARCNAMAPNACSTARRVASTA